MRNPMYTDLVAGRDPVGLLAQAPAAFAAEVAQWEPARWARTYAPGKWSAAQVIQHLVHVEIASGNRIRLALTTPGYVVQPWDTDRWMALESDPVPGDALDAWMGLRAVNVRLYQGLDAAVRRAPFAHPEMGELSIDWFLHTVAGHDLHHLAHLRGCVLPR